MCEKKRVTVFSIAAAILLSAEVTVISLTPLVQIGNGTRFGSTGMYYNILMTAGGYCIPLLAECQGDEICDRCHQRSLADCAAVYLIIAGWKPADGNEKLF